MKDVTIVIPAYNEEKTVGEVIVKCRMQNAECRIIVVSDGSTDRTVEVARQAGAIALSHPINRGLGAALATGIEGALRLINKFQLTPSPLSARGGYALGAVGEGGGEGVIVTLDADGQHDPAEIPKLIESILKGKADVVIGSRFKCRMQNAECRMPLHRRIANWCGNFITWLLFGIHVTDSQSGFRAFSIEAARKIKIRTNTMEVSSEIIREIKLRGLRFKEVPITPIYTDYSLSKGQGFLKGLETLWKLIVLKFFR